MAPSPGFDFTGLVVSDSSELGAAQSVLSVLSLRHILAFVRCELQSPLVSLLTAARLGLWPYGLAIAAFPLVSRPWTGLCWSSVESQLCECPFVVLQRQLVGSGVYSPASPICPTSSVLRRSSFGISASVFASSLRDGDTLPGRVYLTPRSEQRLFLHLPGVWLVSSQWGHPVGSILSQISIGTKTLCTPSLVVGAKPSRWGHLFRVVWRFSAHSIGTKASLFLFYRYYVGHCSDELATCIRPPMARPRSTRQATFAHNYCVELSNTRINRFSDGFFPSTSHLWNSLPSSVFPASFNLSSFKRQVYHHLRGQMA